MAPSEIMRRIKGRSARKLFEEFPELKRRYWGIGFGAWSTGNVTEELIQEYLEIIVVRHWTCCGFHDFSSCARNAAGIRR
jgi:hypothetical protein